MYIWTWSIALAICSRNRSETGKMFTARALLVMPHHFLKPSPSWLIGWLRYQKIYATAHTGLRLLPLAGGFLPEGGLKPPTLRHAIAMLVGSNRNGSFHYVSKRKQVKVFPLVPINSAPRSESMFRTANSSRHPEAGSDNSSGVASKHRLLIETTRMLAHFSWGYAIAPMIPSIGFLNFGKLIFK